MATEVNAPYMSRLAELTAQSIDDQTKAFLRAFVGDFQGKFEQVLDIVEEFRTYLTKGATELDEQQTHYFLEKRGEAQTVVIFREKMKEIDLDFNKRVSAIEYLLYRYKKTLKDLFEAKPNSALIKKLEEAIEKYQSVFRAKKEREAKMAELEALAAQGDKKAKAELMGLKSHDPAKDSSNEISALAEKMKAKRALANPGDADEEAFKQEQQRVAEEQRKKDLEEKKKQEDSRQKLKDRSKLWS